MLIPAMMLWIYGYSVKSTYCSFITISWTHCAGRLYSLFSSFPSTFWPLSFPDTPYRLCERLQILGQRSTPRFSGQLIYASQSETSVHLRNRLIVRPASCQSFCDEDYVHPLDEVFNMLQNHQSKTHTTKSAFNQEDKTHTTIVQTHMNPSDFYRQVKIDS